MKKNINNVVESAIEHCQAGDLKRSEAICYQILEMQPDNLRALNILAIIYAQRSEYDSAIDCLKKALNVDPSHANLLSNLGHAYFEKGDLKNAIRCFRKAIKLNPQLFDAHYRLGTVFHQKGKLSEAITSYRKALSLNPDMFEVSYKLALALKNSGKLDEALKFNQQAAKVNPNSPEIHFNMANIYREKGQIDEAITFYNNVIQLSPFHTMAMTNLGMALQEKQLLDEAIAIYQKALLYDPDSVIILNNLGTALRDKGQPEEALKYFQKAIKLKRSFALPHYNLSLTLLLMGQLKKGWKEYEWRWKVEGLFSPRNFSHPQWDGSSLKGKSILVYSEQGIGDEIMFASCLRGVIAQADLCTVECDKRLMPLFARSFPEIQVIDRFAAADLSPSGFPNADVKIALGSLPKFLRPDFSSFPQDNSFLIPDSHKVEHWSRRFSEIGSGLKIGISWRGGNNPTAQLTRSIILETWESLFSIPGIHWINLQYGECSKELKAIKEKFGIIIHDWEDADSLKDLDNFAAQIAALDLVISVDNSTVHMAGALGVPVWVLLPFAPDWRWMLNRSDSPWYPTVTLFRQPIHGDWEPVITEVRKCLKSYKTI
ncbi:MAG: tetratricopeptide repeat protein [Nitrospirota bacterium]